MAKMLLVNPRRRPAKRRKASPAQRAARARFAAMARSRSRAAKRPARRRKNPAPALPFVAANMPARARRRPARRRNPIGASSAARSYRRGRRRNPISLGRASTYVSMIKDAAIGAAGAVAVDLAMGQINRFLPATLRRTPGTVGIGDAVKAVLTVAMGQLLRGPTRGMSTQLARGALTVQAHGIMTQFLPSTLTLGYATAAPVISRSARIGPNASMLNRYIAPGQTPMLSRYVAPGLTPMLSGRGSTMMRESRVR